MGLPVVVAGTPEFTVGDSGVSAGVGSDSGARAGDADPPAQKRETKTNLYNYIMMLR